MKKNIVLVTWIGARNYGTCLQCYALYKKLQGLGYDMSLLYRKPMRYTLKTCIKGILRELGLLEILKKLKYIVFHTPMSLQDIKRARFQNKFFTIVELYSKRKENKLISRTDCFIAGSDQIWNTFFMYDPCYFLSFAKGVKKISYASSIGTNGVKDEYRNEVRKHLMEFSHIGVREMEAVNVLSNLTGRNDIVQVLDPTFLLSPEEWKEVANYSIYENKLPKDYILCYLIGKNPWYNEQLHDVQNKLGIIDIIILPAAENPDFRFDDAYIYNDASPVEFVDLLQRAKYVCTDSFHATALSINHSVPFVEFMRFDDSEKNSQNSRIYDVLSHYGLMNRIYNAQSSEWLQQIDFGHVQQILKQDRIKSLNYLLYAIEN